jgi:hypothetical protein
MATIRKLRGRWQAQVCRRGMKPRAKSFDSKAERRNGRDLETQVDRLGTAPDTKILESTMLRSVAPATTVRKLSILSMWSRSLFAIGDCR